MKASDRPVPTASVVRVERVGDRLVVTVDGKPLPFEVESVSSMTGLHAHPGITLSIPAGRVEIVDALEGRVTDDRRDAARAHLEALSPGGRK